MTTITKSAPLSYRETEQQSKTKSLGPGKGPRGKDRDMTKLERAIQRAFDKCNLIGETVDIYEVLYSYKAIAQLPDEEIDKIYDTIAEGLGFTK